MFPDICIRALTNKEYGCQWRITRWDGRWDGKYIIPVVAAKMKSSTLILSLSCLIVVTSLMVFVQAQSLTPYERYLRSLPEYTGEFDINYATRRIKNVCVQFNLNQTLNASGMP